MNKFFVGLFIVLFMTAISLSFMSCATNSGSSTPSGQQSQPQKAPAKGG